MRALLVPSADDLETEQRLVLVCQRPLEHDVVGPRPQLVQRPGDVGLRQLHGLERRQQRGDAVVAGPGARLVRDELALEGGEGGGQVGLELGQQLRDGPELAQTHLLLLFVVVILVLPLATALHLKRSSM